MKYIITNILLCFSCILMGQNQSVTAKIDRQNIKIGEQLTLTLETTKDQVVNFPVLNNLDGLEVAQELPPETIKDKLVKKYLITGFDSGAFYIKKQKVFIDNKEYFTDSLLVNVATILLDTAVIKKSINTKELEVDPLTFDEIRYRYGNYLYILLGVILFVILLYYLFRNKKEVVVKQVPKIPPYIKASKELKALEGKELWQKNKIKQYYSELTDIVRAYIGDELLIQSLETTTDELMDLLKTENKQQNLHLSKETLEKLYNLLSQADFVKFAKQKPLESDIQGHQSDAAAIIETIYTIVTSKKTVEEDEVQ